MEREDEVRPVHTAGPALVFACALACWCFGLLLIAAGVVGTLRNLDRLELTVPEQWPFVVLAIAPLWLVIVLNRRNVTSALGAAALAGVGISALLDVQGIAAWRETLIGTVVVIGLDRSARAASPPDRRKLNRLLREIQWQSPRQIVTLADKMERRKRLMHRKNRACRSLVWRA